MTTTIGILGGMGPLATLDFVQKIIRHTVATRDQEHLPLLIHCVPQIPDRTAYLIGDGESPLPALKQGVCTLVGAGVGCIAIPCNTAHHWHGELRRVSQVPVMHIAHACAELLLELDIKTVALMATDGTWKAAFYARELQKYGIRLTPSSKVLQQAIMQGIYLVKAGSVTEGALILERSMGMMLESGVERVILGCTEIPFALDQLGSDLSAFAIDATDALAKACIRWYRQSSTSRVASGQPPGPPQ